MITENIYQTKKTARYYTIGKADKNTTTVWLVLHGYGQLASEFIKDFEILKNDHTVIIAPEGLNKFYFRGFEGKIGASWMTKEDRKNEIDDYVNWISTVFNNVLESVDRSNIKINVLGFSQGTHTAIRWLDYSKNNVDKLFLWGGAFPHDCNYLLNQSYWNNVRSQIIVGNKDRIIEKSKFNAEIVFAKDQNLVLDVIKFDGGHEINSELLLKLAK